MVSKKFLRWLRSNYVSFVGILLAAGLVIVCLLSPYVATYDPAKQDLDASLQGPSRLHLLGTDQLGRDTFSRILWAGRFTITAAAIVLVLSLILGTVVGCIAGYWGGLIDNIFMRVTEIFLSLPSLVLALAIIGALGPGFANLILALSIGWWPTYARVVRSKVCTVKTMDYLCASQLFGASNFHIIRRHILPELMGPILVMLSMDVGHVILSIAALGFLGLGIQPPAPEWGSMLVESRPFMQFALHLVIPPGLAVLITVFGFNSLAEILDKLLEPKS